jgi:uncharacterized membrane protein YraQ (UPF0718 family)
MQGKRKLGGPLFLASTLLAYGVTGLVEPGLAHRALTSFLSMLVQVAPILVLIFALMFLVELYLTPKRARAWLGCGSGVRGWLLAVLAGALSMGPVYTWYGLLAELRAKGMRPALVAVVLYARAVKLPLLPLLAQYFGLRYTLALILSIAAFSLVNGLAMDRVVRQPEDR